MKIVRTESWCLNVPLRRPYAIATVPCHESVELHFVKLIPDRGPVGVGSASPGTHVTGETTDEVRNALSPDRLRPLVGSDALALNQIIDWATQHLAGAPSAQAAVDIAAHDMLARQLELPLTRFLGPRVRPLPTSVTIGILPIKQTVAEAEEHVAAGFGCLKIKLGLDIELDLARLAAVRNKLPSVTIRVDANEGYSMVEAQRFVDEMPRLDIEFVEQPMHRSLIASLSQFSADARKRIALDENIISVSEAWQVLHREHPPGVAVVKLMKCGGIRAARQIAAFCEQNGTELMWGCMDESAISISAALHTAYSCSATRYLDLDGSFELSADPACGGFRLHNGYLYPTDAPGLGVTLKE